MKNKNLSQRAIIIALVTVVGLYVVIGPRHRPKLSDFTFTGLKQTLRENIHLGLDLRGGSQLVMQVQTGEYLQKLATNNALAAGQAAKDQNLPVKDARADFTGGSYKVVVESTDPSKVTDIADAIKKKVDLSDWSQSVSGNTVTWSLTSAAQRSLSQQAVEQALKIIENRINAVGVTEPTIQTHGATGSNEILLQMPDIDDPERVKQLLQSESRLSLSTLFLRQTQISKPTPRSRRQWLRWVVQFLKIEGFCHMLNVQSQPQVDPRPLRPLRPRNG